MNKTLFKIMTFAAAGILAFATACTKGDAKYEVTHTVKVNNLIIPLSPSEPVTVQRNCTYVVQYDVYQGHLTMRGEDVQAGGRSYTFTTDPQPFQMGENGTLQAVSFTGGAGHAAGGASSIEDVKGLLTNGLYGITTNPEVLPGVEFQNPMLFAQYSINGEFTVKTFTSNSYYAGTTKLIYPGEGGMAQASVDDAVYRVYLHEDMQKADVVMYNLKFVPQMPKMEAVILKNLPMVMTREGFSIRATDIVPETLADGATVPMPSKTFDSVEIAVQGGDLSKVKCTYRVAGIFTGEFEGSSHINVQGWN